VLAVIVIYYFYYGLVLQSACLSFTNCTDDGSVQATYSVVKRYILLLAKGRWCSEARKANTGLVP